MGRRRKSRARRRTRGALALALWLVAPAALAQPEGGPSAAWPSAAGTWRGTVDGPTGRIALTFQLAQEGERVHGTYDYRGPAVVALNVRVTGVLRGDALTLFEQGAATPILDARLEGRTLVGTYRSGSDPPGRLRATRTD
jgi:hypothetical protein